MANQLFRKKSIQTILKEAQEGLTDSHGQSEGLKKVLKVKDLTFFGIAAVIGTGVFTAIGSASFQGGPAVILLFALTAVACGFAAYCYAEFASTVPVSGSAYTYSYVAFGEIFAWIIGWDLLMEYAIGNIAVAISWSQYFVRVLEGFHIHVPEWMTMDYFSAHNGFNSAVKALHDTPGLSVSSLDESLRNAYNAWTHAPAIGGLHIVLNLPALLIVLLITYVVYIGIRESRTANNIMVLIKLAIILVVIVAGAFYVSPANWRPFMPNGFAGVMGGVSAVFFAYIGFDAISTTAEECEDPQRDLPRAMFLTLIICTVLYIILTLVLTGMTNYSKLNVADPLAFVFHDQNSRVSNWIAGVISVSAIFVIASVLLVYQLGQPRIWMSMSRDGLLPKVFSRIHPRYKTPSFATILTGLFVAIPALFMNLDVVIALTSIGTLFAFVLVCGGVLVLQKQPNRPPSKFKVPYINSQFIMPLLLLAALVIVVMIDRSYLVNNLKVASSTDKVKTVSLINHTDYPVDQAAVSFELFQNGKRTEQRVEFASIKPHGTVTRSLPLQADSIGKGVLDPSSVHSQAYAQVTPGLHYFKSLFAPEGIPMLIFWLVAVVVTVMAYRQRFSLIPVLGLLSCFYLMSQESHTNWYRFLIWLVIGLCIYFSYGFRNSRLSRQTISGATAPNK